MSKLAFKSNEGGTGTVLLAAPVVDTDITVTMPSKSGVLSIASTNIEEFKVNGIKFGSVASASEYGQCSDSASTVAKAVSVPGFTYENGAMVTVVFLKGNTAANPTLSVSGGTACPMIMSGGNLSKTAIRGMDAVRFYYYEGSFYAVGGYAIRDGNGDVITSTYLSKSAASSDYISKTDHETAINNLESRIAVLEKSVSDMKTTVGTVSGEIATIKSSYMTKAEFQSEVDAAFSALG